MPIIIPSDSNSRKAQMEMLREGLEVHNEGCCTANEPCRMRVGMTEVYRQLDEAEQASRRNVMTPSTRAAEPTRNQPAPARDFAVAPPAPRRPVDKASDAQVAMIRKLAASKKITEYKGVELEEFLATMRRNQVDEAKAFMWNAPWPERRTPVATRRAKAAEDGMYRKDGVVYRVQHAIHGNGLPYAKKLVELSNGEWYFEKVDGMQYKLTEADRMTLAEAKEWGALYGTCCVCATKLTDEKSIAAGIGPVCGGRV
jgi:hypothetical protein